MPGYLALDVGEATIGLAVSDDGETVRALYTINRTTRRRDVAAVVEEATRQQAAVLVVGLPLLADGNEGDSARRARKIGELVATEVEAEVVYQDEHLSTFEATERLHARGVHGEALADRIDAEAAKVILEDYLRGRAADLTS